ncbi:copper resistance CopC family protein [Microbacterium sp. 1P10UB]|uniref:copper resistance CopC family protein n=1 Tax=unclassified Microbacterium TaxID=2609290 RepID=UPI0039A09FC1
MRTGRLASALVIAGVVVFAGAQAASAHDSLIAASPASGDTVTALSQVELTFSENLLDLGAGNIVEITGPDGRYYETDCVALAGPTLTTPVALGPAGTYEVVWRAVSSDGHPVSDTYSFEYTPAAGAAVSAGSATPVCGGESGDTAAGAAVSDGAEASAEPDAAASGSSTGSAGDDGIGLGLLLGGGAVVLVGAAVILILRTRTR